jgi:AAA domain/Bifunctional DNA primase/polymerase, N-terminal
LFIPRVTDNITPLEAALAYAEAGWYVIPVSREGDETGKNPGSLLGGDWPRKSSRDSDQIREWFSSAYPPRNIALHVGRSGAVVFDHDQKELPRALQDAIRQTHPPKQSTPSGGAHYVFAQPPGRNIGNSTGKLGPEWGEVRGQNGVIIVAPSISVGDHSTAYRWIDQGGTLVAPQLPDEVSQLLPDAGVHDRSATMLERSEFLSRYTGASASSMLQAVIDHYRKRAHAGSRHETLIHCACWAMREARAGFYPAQTAYDMLWQEFEKTAGRERYIGSEFEGIIDWAIGQTRAMSQKQLEQQIAARDIAVADEEVTELDGKLLDTFGLDSLPDPEWLIQGWLEMDSVARMVGKSRHGKSFVALDMAAAVGQGLPWHGHNTKRGEVIYMAAEGAYGMKKRVRAWESYHKRRMKGIYIYPEPIQINNRYWDVFIEVLKRREPVLVVLDTQARITVSLDENSATDMGMFVHRIEQARQESGACVMPVHHLGHNGKEGRGSTAVVGAMTSEIRVTRLGDKDDDPKEQKEQRPIEVELAKQKNAEDGLKLEFELKKVDLGVDLAGFPVDSAVIRRLDRVDLDAMLVHWEQKGGSRR